MFHSASSDRAETGRCRNGRLAGRCHAAARPYRRRSASGFRSGRPPSIPPSGSEAEGGEELAASRPRAPIVRRKGPPGSAGRIGRGGRLAGAGRRRVRAAQHPCRAAGRRIGPGDGGAGLLLSDIGEADGRTAFGVVEGQGAVLGRPEPRFRIGIAADAAIGRQGDTGRSEPPSAGPNFQVVPASSSGERVRDVSAGWNDAWDWNGAGSGTGCGWGAGLAGRRCR